MYITLITETSVGFGSCHSRKRLWPSWGHRPRRLNCRAVFLQVQDSPLPPQPTRHGTVFGSIGSGSAPHRTLLWRRAGIVLAPSNRYRVPVCYAGNRCIYVAVWMWNQFVCKQPRLFANKRISHTNCYIYTSGIPDIISATTALEENICRCLTV